MKMHFLASVVAVSQMLAAPAWADRDDWRSDRPDNRGNGHGNNGRDNHHDERHDGRHNGQADRHSHDNYRGDNRRGPVFVPQRSRSVYVVPPSRQRHYNNVVIVRPYGHWYDGYGHYNRDDSAFKWLAFTAITLKVLDIMSESQQRALEDAQIRAAMAPVGAPINWNNGNAYGSVTALRDGTSANGRYCREFQQQVVIGGRRETAYGSACQQPDGSWEMISN